MPSTMVFSVFFLLHVFSSCLFSAAQLLNCRHGGGIWWEQKREWKGWETSEEHYRWFVMMMNQISRRFWMRRKKNEKRVVDYFDWNARKVFPSTVDFISIKTERNKQSHRSPSERMPTRISHLIERIHAVCSSPPPPCAYHNLCFLAVVSQTDRGDDDENLIIPAARVSHTETGPTTTTARRGWIIKASKNEMKLMIISRSLDCKESAIRPHKRALLFVLLTSSCSAGLG